MMLRNKNAVIYGAGGSIGSAVAFAMAEAGANVFLSGRNLAAVKKVADEINASGKHAEADEVDALDEPGIKTYLDSVVAKAGSIDITFNAIGFNVVQNIPLIEIGVEDFISPVAIGMRSQFLTAKAAAGIMIPQRSGVILSLTATPGGIGYPLTGGFAIVCSAMETFSGNLAAELGVYGIRVVNVRSGGSPDSKVFKDAIAANPREMDGILKKMEQDTMLKKLPLMNSISNVLVFMASDLADAVTGVTVDATCGTTGGLNYRMS